MKTFGKVLSAIVVASMMLMTSCSKDADPADKDFFLGKYEGSVSYTSPDQTASDENGSVTVVKAANTYTFQFSSGIPRITGVKLQETDGNTVVSVGDGVTGITIDASTLKMAVTSDGKTWTADCTR